MFLFYWISMCPSSKYNYANVSSFQYYQEKFTEHQFQFWCMNLFRASNSFKTIGYSQISLLWRKAMIVVSMVKIEFELFENVFDFSKVGIFQHSKF